VVLDEDRPRLTAMVTDCLIDAKPIDGEFRIVRPDGDVRTVHMMGEPVLDADGSTASMWAVLRDVSELRRSQRTVSETRDSLQHQRHFAQTERRLAVELQEAVLPPWRGSLRLPRQGPETLDLAARYLPSSTSELIGGDWYDALELPDGDTLLSVGDLTGRGVTVTSGMAMMIGALRGMAVAGTEPGQLMAWLNQLLDASVQPALGSAVCCRYRPESRTLTWAQAGHPAPLLFRNGTGRMLSPPDGVLLGATSGAVYGQAEETLEPGDLLLLHTDGLVALPSGHTGESESEAEASRASAVSSTWPPASARPAPHRTAYGWSWRSSARRSARTTPAYSSPGLPPDTGHTPTERGQADDDTPAADRRQSQPHRPPMPVRCCRPWPSTSPWAAPV
jgi:hypothetical protein